MEIRLAEGRVLSGTVRSLEDDRVKILPFFGGRPESVEIEEIESARPILRA